MTPIQTSIVAEQIEEQAAGDGAEDAGEEGRRFEDAVAAREDVRLQDFGHGAVLGGGEEGGVRAHQEDA